MEEIWKDIGGYEGVYQISNLGRVKSLNYNRERKEVIMKQKNNNNGYMLIGLRKNNKQFFLSTHRLVAIAFIPNTYNKREVNHIDGDKSNNCAYNLEWVTPSENTKHAYAKGLRKNKSKEFMIEIAQLAKGKRSKPVAQYNLNGELVSTYNSMLEAQREGGFDSVCISNCCNGKYKTHAGYIWKYKTDEL